MSSSCAWYKLFEIQRLIFHIGNPIYRITRSHKLLISPWCHELKFSGSWNIIPQYMVHHHCAGKLYMEITNERWRIISSFVHSSLVMHCRNRLKFLMLKVTRRTASYPIDVFLVSLGLIMFKHHDDRLTPFPATLQNSTSLDISLWISISPLSHIPFR